MLWGLMLQGSLRLLSRISCPRSVALGLTESSLGDSLGMETALYSTHFCREPSCVRKAGRAH